MHHRFNLRAQSRKPEVILANLTACTEYAVRVNSYDEDKTGSMRILNLPPTFITSYDPNDPPKNVQWSNGHRSVYVTWEHNCRLPDAHTQFYILKVAELTRNTSDLIEVRSIAGSEVLWYNIDIEPGAVYNISLLSEGQKSTKVIHIVSGPELRSPQNLTVQYIEDTATFEFNWDEVELNETT